MYMYIYAVHTCGCTSILTALGMYIVLSCLGGLVLECWPCKPEIVGSNPDQGSSAFFFEISCLPRVLPFALPCFTVFICTCIHVHTTTLYIYTSNTCIFKVYMLLYTNVHTYTYVCTFMYIQMHVQCMYMYT